MAPKEIVWYGTRPDPSTQAISNLTGAWGVNPDEAAKARALARTAGVPPVVAQQQKPAIELQVKNRDAAQALQAAPRTRDFLAKDPANAQVAHDQITGMTAGELAMKAMRELMRIPRGLASSVPALNEGLWGVMATTEAVGADLGFPGSAQARDFYLRQAQAARGTKEDVAGDQTTWLGRMVSGAAQSLGLQAPGLVAAVVTRNPAYAIVPSATVVGGQSGAKALEAGRPGWQSAAYGAADAGAEAVFEKLPIGRLLKDLDKGVGFGKLLLRQLMVEVPTEVATTITQNLNEWAVINPEKPISEFLREQPAAIRDTIVQTILQTGAMTGTARVAERVATRFAAQEQAAAAAPQALETFDEVVKATTTLPLAERSSETHREWLDAVAEGVEVMVPQEPLVTYLQSLPPEEVDSVVDQLGIREQLEASTPETDIVIPAAAYLQTLAEAHSQLKNDIRLGPSALSVNEAKAFEGERDQLLAQEAERVLQESGQAAADAEPEARVRQHLYEQAVAAGRPETEAMALATIGARHYATRARNRTDLVDAWGAYTEANPSFAGPRGRGQGPAVAPPGAAGPTTPAADATYPQANTLRKGQGETLAKLGLDPSKSHKTRDIAAALEKRQQKRWGKIARDDRSPKTVKKIASWMADEVMFEVQNPDSSGVGWYTTKFQNALDIFAQEFPELANDQGARDTLTALIAITSDGQKVLPNFRQAVDIFSNFRQSGRFTTERGHMRQASIDNNLQKIQQLYDQFGAEGLRELLLTEATVSELNKKAAELGVQFSTAYQATTKLPYAAVIFGPKLGAFYANLMGADGYLTMDRWWSRTFNRYRGDLLEAPTEQGLARVRELIAADLGVDPASITEDQFEAEVRRHRDAYAANDFKGGTEIQKAANTLYKAMFENLNDQPFSATDRTFMLQTVAEAKKQLSKRGVEISVADIQAVLWYYEKRLYGDLGARQSADASYEETAQQVVGERGADPAAGSDAREALLAAAGDGAEARAATAGDEQSIPVFQQGPDPRGFRRGVAVPVADAEGNVTLSHWSSKGRLSELDPDMWGENWEVLPDEEKVRVGDAPGRVYWGIGEGLSGEYQPEYGIGAHRYETTVPLARLYDGDTDPDGFLDRAKREIQEENPDDELEDLGAEVSTRWEELIRDAGYAGYRTRNESIGLVAAVFEKLPAKYKGKYEAPSRDTAGIQDFTPENLPDLLDRNGWALMTAENPAARTDVSAADNAKFNAALERELKKRKLRFHKVEGHYGQEENSYIVLGITETDALALGQMFGQESVLTRRGLVYADGTYQPAQGVTVHETAPEDFYTRVPATGGLFTVDIDFDQRLPLPAATFQQTFAEAGIQDVAKEADRELAGRAKKAIDSFIGHEHDAAEKGATSGVMYARPLEAAYAPDAKGVALETRQEIEEAFAPVREAVRARVGDTLRLYRMQGKVQPTAAGTTNLSAGEDGSRNVLSWTTDPRFANDYAGVRQDPTLFTEEEITAFEEEFERTGKVQITKRTSLRKETLNGWTQAGEPFSVDTVMIYNGEEAITDTDSVRDFVETLNSERQEDIDRNAERRARVLVADVPLDEVVWISDRANQSEFIVRNRPEGIFVDPTGALNKPVALQQEARGQVGFTDVGPLIELFRTANSSTVLHEFAGHVWLEELARDAGNETASQRVREDMNLVRSWWRQSLDDVAKETGMDRARLEAAINTFGAGNTDVEAIRPFHEMFARAAERYFMEGKAPSQDLAAPFRRFRNWLVGIYRDLRRLNTPMTDEIRGVFDRLVAGEDAIAQAAQAQGYQPFFPDAATAGMTQAEYAAYVRSISDADEDATDRLLARLMGDIRRKRTKAWNAERDTLIEEFTEQVNSTPEMQALTMLEEGHARLDANAVGDEANLYKRFRNYLATDGLHPDVLAEQVGLPSGEALLDALRRMKEEHDELRATDDKRTVRQARIEALADAEMIRRHGDVLNDGTIGDEAQAALHDVRRSEALMTEIRALVRRAGAQQNPRWTTEEMERWAAEKLGVMPMGKIRPHVYEVAEAKAGRDALKALVADDFQAALDAKFRQLLNMHLAKAARAARASYERNTTLFERIVAAKDGSISKSRNMDLVGAARMILANYGFVAGKNDADYMAKVRMYDPELWADIEPVITAAMARNVPISELTIDEFNDVAQVVRSLWELSIAHRQIQLGLEKHLVDDLAQDLADNVLNQGPMPAAGPTGNPTVAQRVQRTLQGFRAHMRRVENWVDRMDGGATGPWRRYVWQPISDAATRYRLARNESLRQLVDILEPIRAGLTVGRIEASELGPNGHIFGQANGAIGKSELLHALLHTGNSSNKRKLLLGREWATERADGTLDTTAWDRFIDRMHTEGVITAEDWAFVQRVWDLLEGLKPDAQRAHRAVFGRYFEEITAEPVDTPFGRFRGGYVPAIVDTFFVQDQALNAAADAVTEGNAANMFPSPARGFTKARVEYNRPLALDLQLLPMHMDKVLKFTYLTAPVRDVLRLLKHRTLSQPLERYDPVAVQSMLLPWLNRAANQTVSTVATDPAGRAAGNVLTAVRSRAGMGIMMANLSNTVQQITGWLPAALKVRKRYLTTAIWRYTRSPRQMALDVAAMSPFMETRLQSQVMDIQQEIDGLLLRPKITERITNFSQRHAYILQQMAQNVVDLVAWQAGFEQAIQRGDSYEDAIHFADSVIRETQGSLNPEDVSAWETGSPLKRLFTQFFSYFSSQGNLLTTEFSLAKKLPAGARTVRTTYVYLIGLMLPAVISEIIRKSFGEGWDDDDDDGYLDTFLDTFFGSQARYAAGMLPVVGQLATVAAAQFNDKRYDDALVPSPVISTVEQAASAPHSVFKALTDEDASDKKAIRDSATLMTQLTGVPLFNVAARPLGYLADVNQGKVQPTGPLDFVRGLATGRASEASKVE